MIKEDSFFAYNLSIEYADRSYVSDGRIDPTGIGKSAYPDMEPFIRLDVICQEDCRYDSVSTVYRSNFRSITRDFPDFPFVRIGYSNGDTLGVFLADLTADADMGEMIRTLADEYPVYDESDMSELESEEITASWEQYVAADLYRTLPDDAQEVWTIMGDTFVERVFWSVLARHDYYPEHGGLDIHWDSERIGAWLAAALVPCARAPLAEVAP